MYRGRLLLRAVLVFLASLACLSWRVWDVGLAAGYVDPVGRIAAQDEAVYAHIATRMAERGDWLTPKFLGRYALFKPPLLYWASAACVRLFGPSVFAIRLPSLIAGALVATVLFLWIPDWRGGLIAVLLLIGNPLWHILSRVALTDALLALWVTLAVWALAHGRPWSFSAATAAAILTKGIAGLMPLFIAAVWGVWRTETRAKFKFAPLAAFAFAAPWFLYQWIAHPLWFRAEFIDTEILGFSLGAAPPQTSDENTLAFYARRLLFTDPALIALAVWGALRRPWSFSPAIAWALTALALVLSNSYRNATYLLPVIPALCWLAGQRKSRAVLATLAALFVLRAANPAERWGLPYASVPPVPAARAVAQYAALHRDREFIVIDPSEQFVAANEPIPRLRYCFLGDEADYRRYALNFRHLGIALTVEEYLKLPEGEAVYRDRLRQWGLDSAEPIATVIVAKDPVEVARFIAARPATDFLIAGFTPPESPHERRPAGEGRLLLLGQ